MRHGSSASPHLAEAIKLVHDEAKPLPISLLRGVTTTSGFDGAFSVHTRRCISGHCAAHVLVLLLDPVQEGFCGPFSGCLECVEPAVVSSKKSTYPPVPLDVSWTMHLSTGTTPTTAMIINNYFGHL